MNFDFNYIFNRAKNILIKPIDEWTVIKNENLDKKQIISNYVIPFTIAIFLASLIGNFMFMSFFSFSFKFLSALITALTSILGILISSYVITELAPNFGSKKDLNATFNLVAFSFTASFVVSIITGLLPALSILSIAGLYSIYLLYTGLTPLLDTTEDKKVSFLVVAFLIIIVVYIILAFVLGLIISPFLAASVLSI